jgi:hypothetical protein
MKHSNCIWLMVLTLLMPLQSLAASQWAKEAEVVSGGQVVADEDASNAQAVTRADAGIYTWWTLNAAELSHGRYAIYVRARSLDGQARSFSESVKIDGQLVDTLSATVDHRAYRWYRLGFFDFATGQTLLLADWSSPSLQVDKLIIEPIVSAAGADIAGGNLVADSGASTGQAIVRQTAGPYTWYVHSVSPPHGNYSVYVRVRALGAATTFTQHVVVNGKTVAVKATEIGDSNYRWVRAADFEYTGSNLRLSDYSSPGLAVDRVALVQSKPKDETLSLYHLWYGNAHLAGIHTQQAEAVAGGSVFDDELADDARAVSRDSVGIYTYWTPAASQLVVGQSYTVDVRARSLDGGTHSFGMVARSNGNVLAEKSSAIGSSIYGWYKALNSFVYDGGALTLGDWSDPGLAIDSIRLTRTAVETSGDGYRRIGFFAQGNPSAPGITETAARVSIVPVNAQTTYAYFRDNGSTDRYKVMVGTSTDAGLNFEVRAQPVIDTSTTLNVPGYGVMDNAYDPSVIRTSDGYQMVFEASGPQQRVSSLLAHSADGLNGWDVRGPLVKSAQSNGSASTPNLIRRADSGELYLQWVNVHEFSLLTSRHQASLSYLTTWNPGAVWPQPAAVFTDTDFGQLPQAAAGSWDDKNFGSGSVLFEDGIYYMAYEGANHPFCEGNWGIGMARNSEATLADPGAWEKSSLNPWLKAINSGTCWISYPHLSKLNGRYYLYYQHPEIEWTPTGQINDIYRRRISVESE